ncbi:hypothetical protein [Phyllobacterium meliloti]|uniref:hypothetical protein n=1 Tax=Phyllobacterium meliloti TaxID=555317 RepID=UPI001D1397F5|nr:hypothetical protein [Phyllobacterium sp. T1293]UGX85518.1 hypothetical protein LLE53_013780 [Phyllobacterium sp. T1293]
MAHAKLHIDLNQGIIDADGDETFVLSVYNDFKNIIVSKATIPAVVSVVEKAGHQDNTLQSNSKTKSKTKKTISKKTAVGTGEAVGISSHKPSLVKSLNLSDLTEFISKYEPKNNADAILLFTKFLDEKLSITPCTVDQIYTCFLHIKRKIPKAFGQSFIDARGNSYGYIDFTNTADITITTIGLNRINHELEK